MRQSKKTGSISFGPRGATIRIYRDKISRIWQADCPDKTLRSGVRTISLGHRDKARAIEWAQKEALLLAGGLSSLTDPTPKASKAFGIYLANQTPHKVESEQEADGRRTNMWIRVLGPNKDLRLLTLHEWQRFIRDRLSGTIDSYGCPVPEDQRRPVSIGTVASDLIFLRSVIHWAMKWQDEFGRYLMREDPTRGFEIPTEKNPRRPVVTTDRYLAVLAAAESMPMRIRWNGKPEYVRSHLADILVLCWHTGRRISAILSLRFEDLRLSEGPYGSIRWPARSDKLKKEWVVPVAREVREVLDRIIAQRPGIGAAPIFPAPNRLSKSVSKDTASTWLVQAEQLAGVPKQDGSLFHAYRRAFATSRKHLSDTDVAAAGGWSDTTTLKQAYQLADAETMYLVVSQPNEIRSVQ